jgi:hypothetical protein
VPLPLVEGDAGSLVADGTLGGRHGQQSPSADEWWSGDEGVTSIAFMRFKASYWQSIRAVYAFR